MVEINNQRKAFLDMLAWSEELITDVENQKFMVMTSLWRKLLQLLDHPHQTCHAKPKTQINRRGRYKASFRWWDAYRKNAWPERLLSEKVRTLWHCSRLRSVALYHD